MATVQQGTKVRTTITQSIKHELDMGPLPPNRIPETIWVVRKRDGAHIQVNEKDYGKNEDGTDRRFPSHHYEQDHEFDEAFYEPPGALGPVAVTSQKCSGYTDDDIRKLTAKEIKELPEYKAMGIGRFKGLPHMREEVIKFRATLNEKPGKKTKRKTLGSSEQASVVGS